jgi:hypothetical protein
VISKVWEGGKSDGAEAVCREEEEDRRERDDCSADLINSRYQPKYKGFCQTDEGDSFMVVFERISVRDIMIKFCSFPNSGQDGSKSAKSTVWNFNTAKRVFT